MAEQSILKLEDQLNCSICLETYTNPKVLQCNHIFCQQCLAKLVVRDQRENLHLACPSCRQITPVPTSGVAGLQPAFQINRLLEILREHKADSLFSRSSPSRINPEPNCPAHPGKEVELYCETCEEAICFKCAVKGGRHHHHEYVDLKEAFDNFKEQLLPSLEPIKTNLKHTREALMELEACSMEISDQQASIEANVHKEIDRLHKILNSRKRELLSQAHSITERKLKSLAVQRDHLETIQAQLSSYLEFVKESLRVRSHGDVLMMRANTIQQMEEFSAGFQPVRFEANVEADLIFSAPEDLSPFCEDFGKVYTPRLPDPSKCRITSKSALTGTVGETSSVVLQTVNFQGEPCEDTIWQLDSELVSETTGEKINARVERRGESEYKICFRPTVKGRHQLHIKVSGQHVRGSPHNVTVKEHGDDIGTISEVKGPWGVAVLKSGEMVVTEQDTHSVSIYSRRGEKLRSFGSFGSDYGQFQCPHGVTVDGAGNILVADSNNHRIQKFTADGEFLATVGTQGSGRLKFSHPLGVAFNMKDNKLYVLDGNHCVQVLNSDLTFSGTFGTYGSGKGQFLRPCAVACDSTGHVYVADSGNNRVQVFSGKGKFLRMFGGEEEGSVTRGLKFPAGVAVGERGEVYVSETNYHRLSVFSPDGQFLTSRGHGGREELEFSMPYGVAVDQKGVVWVCDRYNYRVLTPFHTIIN